MYLPQLLHGEEVTLLFLEIKNERIVISYNIWQSSEIYNCYSPSFAVKCVHNATLKFLLKELIIL